MNYNYIYKLQHSIYQNYILTQANVKFATFNSEKVSIHVTLLSRIL